MSAISNSSVWKVKVGHATAESRGQENQCLPGGKDSMYLQPSKSRILELGIGIKRAIGKKELENSSVPGCAGGSASRYRDHKLRSRLGFQHLVT